jgi:hypothetical protein
MLVDGFVAVADARDVVPAEILPDAPVYGAPESLTLRLAGGSVFLFWLPDGAEAELEAKQHGWQSLGVVEIVDGGWVAIADALWFDNELPSYGIAAPLDELTVVQFQNVNKINIGDELRIKIAY